MTPPTDPFIDPITGVSTGALTDRSFQDKPMNTPQTPSNDSYPHGEARNAALEGSAQHLKTTVAGASSDIAESAQGLLRRRAHDAQQRALHLRDSGSALIRERPMQAVLVAAGAGAIVMLLLGLLARGAAAQR